MGRSVTLINGTNPTRDPDHGDIRWEKDRTEAVAEIAYRGEPSFSKRADGVATSLEAIVWVDSSESVTAGSDDDTSRATRIDVGGSTLVVRDVFDEDNGLLRCHCEVED